MSEQNPDNLKYYLDKSQPVESPLGRIFYPVVAAKDFGDVKAGTVGGCVEGEKNLSQEGNCWIEPGSFVGGGAVVRKDARVRDSVVLDFADVGGQSVIKNSEVRGNPVFDGNCLIEGARPTKGLHKDRVSVRATEGPIQFGIF